MYKFSTTDNIKEFDQFVLKNNGSFFQTSAGANMKKAWKPIYFVGQNKQDEIVLTALLLVRKIFKGVTIGYFHSGFACDYDNKKLVDEMFAYFKKYANKHKLSFVFFDPEIITKIDGNKQNSADKYHKQFIDSGLSITSLDNPFIQPRFTYIINLLDEKEKTRSLDEVVSGFEKGVRSSIRTSSSKGLKHEQFNYEQIKTNPSIMDEFMNVMNDTMERLETTTRTKEYYLNVLESLRDYIVLDMIYYDYNEDYRLYEEYKKEIDKAEKSGQTKKINEYQSKIDAFNRRVTELVDAGYKVEKDLKLYLAAGITVFFGDKTTCLYGGTKNILRNATRSSHYLNYKRIESSVKRKMKYHDFLRAHVVYRDERDKNYGLSQFKKSFGANEIEYLGEYVIVMSKMKYMMFKLFYKRLNKLLLFVKRRRG